MNRNRFTTMRSMDRSQEPGLQQILQPSATGQLPNQGGNQAQQTVRRKTTYTRTELLLRGLPTSEYRRRGVAPPTGPCFIHLLISVNPLFSCYPFFQLKIPVARRDVLALMATTTQLSHRLDHRHRYPRQQLPMSRPHRRGNAAICLA